MTHPEAENSHCHIKDVFGHNTSTVAGKCDKCGKCERNRLCSGINLSRLSKVNLRKRGFFCVFIKQYAQGVVSFTWSNGKDVLIIPD